MSSRFVRRGVTWVIYCAAALYLLHLGYAQLMPDQSRSATSLNRSVLIQPVELANILQSGKSKPLIINVGPKTLYLQAHIPGAQYIGPGSDPEAIQELHARAQSLPHSTWIVLYCGCCPWTHCPNVAPAFTELQRMGFTNVKVLYIADNLGTDWAYKGYPTDRGNN